MLARTQQVAAQTARPVSRTLVPVVEAKAKTSRARTAERHRRLRKKLSGTTERPRLAVFRSNEHIYAQVIDDTMGHTLVSASTLHPDLKTALEEGNGANIAAATAVGAKIAELCKAKNIEKVAFDRGGFAYHGRVKAVADGAREAGLDF